MFIACGNQKMLKCLCRSVRREREKREERDCAKCTPIEIPIFVYIHSNVKCVKCQNTSNAPKKLRKVKQLSTEQYRALHIESDMHGFFSPCVWYTVYSLWWRYSTYTHAQSVHKYTHSIQRWMFHCIPPNWKRKCFKSRCGNAKRVNKRNQIRLHKSTIAQMNESGGPIRWMAVSMIVFGSVWNVRMFTEIRFLLDKQLREQKTRTQWALHIHTHTCTYIS